MQWIQIRPMRDALRLRAQSRVKVQWEEWVTQGENPCQRCKVLDGKRYVQGRAQRSPAQPVTDTHKGCQCQRLPVAGRFASSARRRALDKLVRRSLRTAGFVVRSCKDCD